MRAAPTSRCLHHDWQSLLHLGYRELQGFRVLKGLKGSVLYTDRASVANSSLMWPGLVGHLDFLSVRADRAVRPMADHALVAPLQLFYRLLTARALQALMISHALTEWKIFLFII